MHSSNKKLYLVAWKLMKVAGIKHSTIFSLQNKLQNDRYVINEYNEHITPRNVFIDYVNLWLLRGYEGNYDHYF